MKRLSLSLMLFMLTAVAHAQPGTRLGAELGGAEEVRTANIPGPAGTCDPASGTPPCVTIPIGPLVTGGAGAARFWLSPDRSTLNYHVTASGTGTPLFMGHIHLGPVGANGPVMFWLFGDQSNAPFPLPRNDGPWTGEISGTLTAANLTAQPALGIVDFDDAVANVLRGNAYVNFHTTANPAGELRGQISRHHGRGPFGGGPFP